MTDWLEYWYKALHSPIGIAISVNDPEAARMKLYNARANAGDETLSGLAIVLPPNGELWILKKVISHVEKE